MHTRSSSSTHLNAAPPPPCLPCCVGGTAQGWDLWRIGGEAGGMRVQRWESGQRSPWRLPAAAAAAAAAEAEEHCGSVAAAVVVAVAALAAAAAAVEAVVAARQ
eukprot:1155746-Pelagomonas_calceolata.AAC.5